MSASAAADQLGIYIRAAQKWLGQYNMCPDSIIESCKNVGRKCILTEEQKQTVINFIDTAVVEVAEAIS